MDNVDEKIDTVIRGPTLALTVSCARCHDHKFDPDPAHRLLCARGHFREHQDRTGLRSRMGGAGLDYYDPESLTTLSQRSAGRANGEDPPTGGGGRRCEEGMGRDSRHIRGLGSGSKRPAKAAAVPSEV